MSEPVITIYVVYNSPDDFPGKIVVRAQDVYRSGLVVAHASAGICDDIEVARAYCARMGLTRIPRQPDDVPAIVEVWL